MADISSTAKTKLIDIEPEIEAILSEYSSRLEQKKIKVVVDFRKRLKLKANPGYIQMFFSNFIENAIKYNKQK